MAFCAEAFAAPELLKYGICSAAVDVYALGVVAFRTLTGKYPPICTRLAKLQRLKGDLNNIPGNHLWNMQISSPARQLVMQMLWQVPAERISVDSALEVRCVNCAVVSHDILSVCAL